MDEKLIFMKIIFMNDFLWVVFLLLVGERLFHIKLLFAIGINFPHLFNYLFVINFLCVTLEEQLAIIIWFITNSILMRLLPNKIQHSMCSRVR